MFKEFTLHCIIELELEYKGNKSRRELMAEINGVGTD